MLIMNEDIINQAKEIRRKIHELEIKINVIGFDDIETKKKLMTAIKQFNQVDADGIQNMMKIHALQIVNEYTTLASNDVIEVNEDVIIPKYNNVVIAYNKMLKEKDNLQNQNSKLLDENNDLAESIRKLMGIFEKLGIKLDNNNQNPSPTYG